MLAQCLTHLHCTTVVIAVAVGVFSFSCFHCLVYDVKLNCSSDKERMLRFRQHYPLPYKSFTLQRFLYNGPLYTIARFRLTDKGRLHILQVLLPQMNKEGFDYQRLLKTFYKNMYFDPKGLRVWNLLIKRDINTIDEFKRFILTAGVKRVVLEKMIKKSVDNTCTLSILKNKQPVETPVESENTKWCESRTDLSKLIVGKIRESLAQIFQGGTCKSRVSVSTDIQKKRVSPAAQPWSPDCVISLDNTGHKFKGPITRTIEVLKEIRDNECTCPICLDTISVESKIWSCGNCSTVIHWNCIREWSKSQETSGYESQSLCVNCREVCQPPEDNRATCWCGKQPYVKNHVNPNSCGKMCNFEMRLFSYDGPVTQICMLPCHPGPHLLFHKTVAAKQKLCGHCLIKKTKTPRSERLKKDVHF